MTSVDKIGTYHDVDVTEGGPIKRDRLWFFGSGRMFTVNKPIASTFVSDPAQVGQCQRVVCQPRGVPLAGVACAQGVDDQTINSALGRVTLQVGLAQQALGCTWIGFTRIARTRWSPGDDQTTTSVHWTSPLYLTSTAKWTTTVSGQWLIEGGWSTNIERYDNLYQPGIEQPAEHAALVRDGQPSGHDRQPAQRRRHARVQQLSRIVTTGRASASYVTGSHNIKFGFQDSYGPYNQKYIVERRSDVAVSDAERRAECRRTRRRSTRRIPCSRID